MMADVLYIKKIRKLKRRWNGLLMNGLKATPNIVFPNNVEQCLKVPSVFLGICHLASWGAFVFGF